MRIGSIELRRSYATAPSGDTVEAPSAQAYGGDDPSVYGSNLLGVRPNENPEMQGRLRYAVFDEMRWGDPAVKSSLWLYKYPMRNATYTLIPRADPVDRVVADAVAWQFGLSGKIGRMDLSWREQLTQAYLKLDYGAMFEEMVWPEDVEPWYDADGDAHLVRPISRLAPRFPATLRMPGGIVTNELTGMIEMLIQDTPGARPIPGDKLVWYTLDREGTDWLGTSLLRAMLMPWRSKRSLLVSSASAWERYGVGVPAIWYPRGGGEQRKREAENIGRNWRNHPRAYFTFEGRRGGDGSGWDVDILDATINDAVPMLQYYDEQISTAAMQHFMVLGRTSGGNRALGEALGEPFYLAAQAIAEDVLLQKQRLAFRRFVDVNFGRDIDVPEILVSNIQSRDILQFAQAIAALADAGLSFADPGTQDDIRERLDLDALPRPVAELVDGLPDEIGLNGPDSVSAPQPGGPPAGIPSTGLRPVPAGQIPVRTDPRPPEVARYAREGDDLGL